MCVMYYIYPLDFSSRREGPRTLLFLSRLQRARVREGEGDSQIHCPETFPPEFPVLCFVSARICSATLISLQSSSSLHMFVKGLRKRVK